MHQIKRMKASELIEDFSIYPRNGVYDGHVYDLAESLRAGAALPPIVACKKSKRLTDGFHRRRANIRVFGEDAEVEVMLVDFENEAAMVLDAIKRNASHGRRLTTADIARCAALAKTFKLSRERLTECLGITREKLKDITATRFASGKSGPVVLRRPMVHLAGKKLTEAQEEVAPHVGGHPAVYLANRLIDLIGSGSLPPDDENLFERLKQLHQLLEELLVTS